MFIPDPGFRFFYPDSGSKRYRIRSTEWTKNLSIFNPKNYYVYPDARSGYFLLGSRISDPGVKKALDPG
jgi:hypothetical protein